MATFICIHCEYFELHKLFDFSLFLLFIQTLANRIDSSKLVYIHAYVKLRYEEDVGWTRTIQVTSKIKFALIKIA